MPELPEVETVRGHLHSQIVGSLIVEITCSRPDLRYPLPVVELTHLRGASIVAVLRRAKYLLLVTDAAVNKPIALVHLGMSGRLFVQHGAAEPWRKHEHWRWRLQSPTGEHQLRYVDARRFGLLDVASAGHDHRLLEHLGPEPLSPQFNAMTLLASIGNRSTPIKSTIMDAAVVVGVGNIYASEACFRAELDPLRPAREVTTAQAERLVAAIQEVLQQAIAAGGSTLRDFVGGDEAPGYFQQQLDVYGRTAAPCNRCACRGVAASIRRVVVGQRATFFCPACQG